MSSFNIATRYATALMNLASEKGILSEIFADMELVRSGISSSKELKVMLKSPIIKLDQKKEVLRQIFEDKITKVSSEFIQFVITKNRENFLYDILLRFKDLYNDKINRVEAKVVSSIELSDNQKRILQTSLEDFTKKEVISTYSIDDSIIGGFIVRINDTVLDSSVKQQLSKLRKKLLQQSNLVLN